MIFLHRPFARMSEPHLVRKDSNFINKTLEVLSWSKKKKRKASFSFLILFFPLLHSDYCSFRSTEDSRRPPVLSYLSRCPQITADKDDKGFPNLQYFLLLGSPVLLSFSWVSAWLIESRGVQFTLLGIMSKRRDDSSPYFKFGKELFRWKNNCVVNAV